MRAASASLSRPEAAAEIASLLALLAATRPHERTPRCERGRRG
jgi:hypothetical protein